MSKLTILITGMLFGVMCQLGPASAATGFMRCGTHTISDSGRRGPGKYEVIKKCGEPTERFGNTWVYDRPGQAKKILRFNDAGQLVTIDGRAAGRGNAAVAFPGVVVADSTTGSCVMSVPISRSAVVL